MNKGTDGVVKGGVKIVLPLNKKIIVIAWRNSYWCQRVEIKSVTDTNVDKYWIGSGHGPFEGYKYEFNTPSENPFPRQLGYVVKVTCQHSDNDPDCTETDWDDSKIRIATNLYYDKEIIILSNDEGETYWNNVGLNIVMVDENFSEEDYIERLSENILQEENVLKDS